MARVGILIAAALPGLLQTIDLTEFEQRFRGQSLDPGHENLPVLGYIELL